MGLSQETNMVSKEKTFPVENTMEFNENVEISDSDMTADTEANVLMTPPQMPVLQHSIHGRNGHDRPQSAHLHRNTGLLLRTLGDQYQCHTCGKALRVIGDEMSSLSALRRAFSSSDIQNFVNTPKR